MLRITLFAVLFFSRCAFAQDYAAVLFDGFIPADQFTILSQEKLIQLCKKHPKAFDQVLTTNGSKNKKDWSLIRESIIKYPDIVEPLGYLIDFNKDSILDLVIAFQAGYEYTYIGFYDGKDELYSCVHEGRGEFYGQSSKGWIYVDKACCEDPTHEFFIVAPDEHSRLHSVDSFSVTSAYGSAFPTREEIMAPAGYFKNTRDLTIVTNSAKTYATIPEGASLRIIKRMEVDEHSIWFAELNWAGNAVLFSKAYCWLLAD